MRMILFDVDGTLLLSGGAGGRALRRAVRETYALSDGSDGVRYDGKTDPQIVREILAWHRKEARFREEDVDSLFRVYLTYLREELVQGRDFQVLPGVRELVSSLCRRENVLVGLATGNIEAGAQLKLERAGLSSFFIFGGFGSDSEHRTEVIRVAIERGLQKATSPLDSVFVVGDTPRDIVHGREAGAQTIAVATGNYSLEVLKKYKPDLALTNLEPIEPVMEFLTG